MRARADVVGLLSRLVPRVEIVEHVVHATGILPEILVFRKEMSKKLRRGSSDSLRLKAHGNLRQGRS
jgi:hypothetical protein